jgi:uncharacterized protein (TIGR03545 family)
MAKKPPRIFRKEYTKDKFDKKILKKIYIKEYKEMLQKSARTTSSGTVVIEAGPEKKAQKQLKKIAKSIKKNTGFVLKGRITLLVLIFGAVFVFGAVFKDMLIEHAAEAGLEAVFNAKADIRGLHFQIFAGRLSFEHLEVADSRKPMRNLFELGRTAFDIDLFELLKGKVILEKIMCRDIKWDTPRQSSGALAGAPAAASASPEQAGPEKQGQPAFNFNITADDVGKIIEEQKQNLAGAKLLDELAGSYADLGAGWQDEISQNSKKLEALSASMDKISGIKVNQIKTLADAQKAYNILKPAADELENLKTGMNTMSGRFNKDLERLKTDRQKLAEAIDADMEKISGLIGLPRAGGGGVTALIAQGLLERYVRTLSSYVYQARTYMEMLRPTSEQTLPEAKPERLTGMDILYPSFVKPKFWLQDMNFSVTDDKSFGTIEGELRNVTGQPDLIGQPMTWSLRQTAGGRSAALDGALDLRKNRSPVLTLALTLENFPYKLEKGLEFLSVAGLDCRYTLAAGFSLDNKNHTSGSLKVKLTELKLSYSENNLISRGLQKALAGLGFISIGARYSLDADGKLNLEITDNNLDKLIGSVISSAIGELSAEIGRKVKQQLDAFMRTGRERFEEQSQKLSGLKKDLDKNLGTLNEYKKTLDAKKKELEKKIADYKKGVLDNLKDVF